jgi:ribosomal protein L40E
MGLLLKIILFGVAVYAAWKTFHRWKGLYDRFVGKPDEPARPVPPAQPPPAPPEQVIARKAPVEDAVQCAGCGAYIPISAEKCGQCGRPQPQGRSSN